MTPVGEPGTLGDTRLHAALSSTNEPAGGSREGCLLAWGGTALTAAGSAHLGQVPALSGPPGQGALGGLLIRRKAFSSQWKAPAQPQPQNTPVTRTPAALGTPPGGTFQFPRSRSCLAVYVSTTRLWLVGAAQFCSGACTSFLKAPSLSGATQQGLGLWTAALALCTSGPHLSEPGLVPPGTKVYLRVEANPRHSVSGQAPDGAAWMAVLGWVAMLEPCLWRRLPWPCLGPGARGLAVCTPTTSCPVHLPGPSSHPDTV